MQWDLWYAKYQSQGALIIRQPTMLCNLELFVPNIYMTGTGGCKQPPLQEDISDFSQSGWLSEVYTFQLLFYVKMFSCTLKMFHLKLKKYLQFQWTQKFTHFQRSSWEANSNGRLSCLKCENIYLSVFLHLKRSMIITFWHAETLRQKFWKYDRVPLLFHLVTYQQQLVLIFQW